MVEAAGRCCVVSVVPGTPSTAICSDLPVNRARAHPLAMGSKSHETIYGASVWAAAEGAAEARRQADRLACEAWNKRMLGFKGPAQPSPALGDAITPVLVISKSVALAATPIRPLPSTSCGDRRQRRSMNSNATCGAASAPKSGTMPTSEAIWWRCERRRFRPVIRPRRGPRASGELKLSRDSRWGR